MFKAHHKETIISYKVSKNLDEGLIFSKHGFPSLKKIRILIAITSSSSSNTSSYATNIDSALNNIQKSIIRHNEMFDYLLVKDATLFSIIATLTAAKKENKPFNVLHIIGNWPTIGFGNF
jgi:glutaredoxin 2